MIKIGGTKTAGSGSTEEVGGGRAGKDTAGFG